MASQPKSDKKQSEKEKEGEKEGGREREGRRLVVEGHRLDSNPRPLQ